MNDQTPALRLAALLHGQAIAIQSQRARHKMSPPQPETTTMTPITFRPWSPSDMEACMNIWRAGSDFAHPFLSAAELDADAILVRNIYMPATDITVAEQAGQVLGFIALSDNFIGALFVHPAHHRRGIGARLLDHAAQHHPTLIVEVYAANHSARDFYAETGFVETMGHLTDDQGRPHPLIRLQRDNSARSLS